MSKKSEITFKPKNKTSYNIQLFRVFKVQYSTVQYSTVQYSTVQYSTVQYSTVQYSTVQYSTVQYSTVQYSTVQYSTVLLAVYCSSSSLLQLALSDLKKTLF